MSFPAGFTLVKDSMVEDAIEVPISSLTVVAGDLLALGAGSTTWALGASSTQHWQLKGVAIEPATTAATSVKVQLVRPGQLWVAETANNSDATHNGDRMVLTDEDTVNNTGSDSAAQTACFVQLATVGAATEKRILGIVVYGTGVDPDAA